MLSEDRGAGVAVDSKSNCSVVPLPWFALCAPTMTRCRLPQVRISALANSERTQNALSRLGISSSTPCKTFLLTTSAWSEKILFLLDSFVEPTTRASTAGGGRATSAYCLLAAHHVSLR